MVIQVVPIMEDEEDLEALRLAALQTLKPRKEPKINYGSSYHHAYHHKNSHYHNKQPFIRMDRNPNLIVIIPTEDNKETKPEAPATSDKPVDNGQTPSVPSLTIPEKPKVSAETPEKVEAKRVESSPDADKVKKTPVKLMRDSRDDDLELNLDEEELDFESELPDEDTIALHADDNDTLTLDVDESDKLALHDEDEDSLEKLMDQMEQEFSEEPVVKADEPKTGGTKTEKKEVPKVENRKKSPVPKETAVVKEKPPVSAPTNLAEPKLPSRRSRSPPLRRSRTPPVYSKLRSPVRRSPSPYRRSRSPRRSPLPLRRSPLPRRSKSPLTRRSRSPFPRRSKSPYRRASPYRRSKSPFPRRTPPRRMSPLPRRSPRRSPPPPLLVRSRSRTRSPPRREYRSRSPLPPRRRSRSPSYLRRSLSGDRRRPLVRRSVSPRRRTPPSPRGTLRRRTPPPRRSPPRNVRRRSASPSRRPPTRRTPPPRRPRPAEPRSRPTESDSRYSKPISRGRSPVDSRVEMDSRREPQSKSRSDEEADKRKDPVEPSDPKLEARRRKFESNAVVSGTQRKIFLRAAADEAKTRDGDTEQSSSSRSRLDDEEVAQEDEAIHVEEEDSSQVVSKASQSAVYSRIGHASHAEDRGLQTRLTTNLTKDSQPKSLLKLIEEEDAQEARKLKPTIRYTVEDAKEEIELMKLKRKRKTERILEEEGENRELLALKKKKKKKDKEKKKEKKKELLAEMANSTEAKSKAERVAAPGRAEGTDLRAELSRRRAQRLQGQPGSRLIQSALEGVVADKKSKPLRLNSPPGDGSTSDDPNKAKGRRVQVITHASRKKFAEKSSGSDSEGPAEAEEAPKSKKTSAGILRGTTLRRRSQAEDLLSQYQIFQMIPNR